MFRPKSGLFQSMDACWAASSPPLWDPATCCPPARSPVQRVTEHDRGHGGQQKAPEDLGAKSRVSAGVIVKIE